jgi:hypothetical protein
MKMAREISVMIWGVISNEFPSKLMWCPERVNAHT